MTITINRRVAAAAGLISLSLFAAGCASSSSAPAAAPASSTSAPSTAGSSGSGASGQTMIKTEQVSLGTVLTNAQGFTLYWFAKDSSTASACSGACAAAWPPVTGSPAAASGVTLPGKLGTITRSDGSTQATYNGHPLYTFKGDGAAGQVTGNGVNGFGALWYAVTSSGSAPATTPAATPTASKTGGYGY